MSEIILLIGGFFMGVMNAIAGGGILLAFPVMLATGVTPLVANASANIAALVASLSSAVGYRSYIARVRPLYMLLLIPCFIGSIIGAILLANTSSGDFSKLIPWLVAFAVILFTLQPYLHLNLHKTINKQKRLVTPFILLSLAILPLAVYGGYFGAGFGFIMLAFLGFSGMHNIHKMNGLKNLAAAIISINALIILLPTGLVDWRSGGLMAIGALFGGYFGSKFAQRMSSSILRYVVIAIGVGTTIYLFIEYLS